MPELAEVDYYRKQWDPGLGKPVTRVHLHSDKRIFRDTDTTGLQKLLPGKKLVTSESSGKQMVFRFGSDCWVGIHLGMTGKLSVEAADYAPQKHDHFVVFQKARALIFNDARQFGRVKFYSGKGQPEWWSSISPAVASPEFTLEVMTEFVRRHKKLPIKGILLKQEGFPGVGNWMADEILWRARVDPHRLAPDFSKVELRRLHQESQFVCREALVSIGKDFSDPPADWLFHQRWGSKGICPKHELPLKREEIAGRTTAWCVRCQK